MRRYHRTYSVHPSATSSPESPPAMDVDTVLAYTANVIAAVKRKTDALRVESFLVDMVCVWDVCARGHSWRWTMETKLKF